jgi:hypothetical protein
MTIKPGSMADRRTRLTCLEIALQLDGVETKEKLMMATEAIYDWAIGKEPVERPTLRVVPK